MKKEKAYAYIKRLILDGKWDLEESINVNEITEHLQMSRTPIHKALTQLEQEGFLTIIPQVGALRLPAIYQWPEITDEGGLIGYGPHITQIYGEILSRQLAALLRGTKPADIPAEQPTKYDLAINLKTAKALGLAIPTGLLARADEVIE